MSDFTPASPPPPASTAPPGPPSGSGAGYPLVLELQRGPEVQNWRPLVNWLLVIPHILVLYVIGIVASVLWFISFFTVLFVKRNPFIGFQTMYLRYEWRVYSFHFFMRNEYPPFDFGTTPGSEMPDPAVLTLEDPGEMNRWLPLVKWLRAIPHYIALLVLWIGAFLVLIVSFFAVLFTGKWPEGLRDYVIGVTRWTLRVNAYIMFLTDEYPPFSLT
jgi:hypothetical protein